jgi:cytochrome P450
VFYCNLYLIKYDLCCLQDIEEGKVSVHHDLLSILMKTLDHESHVITNETIKDNILTYWIASHDTVSTTLSMALKYLFLNPHCLHEVVKGKHRTKLCSLPLN